MESACLHEDVPSFGPVVVYASRLRPLTGSHGTPGLSEVEVKIGVVGDSDPQGAVCDPVRKPLEVFEQHLEVLLVKDGLRVLVPPGVNADGSDFETSLVIGQRVGARTAVENRAVYAAGRGLPCCTPGRCRGRRTDSVSRRLSADCSACRAARQGEKNDSCQGLGSTVGQRISF